MVVDAHTHIFTDAAYRDYQRQANGKVDKIITIHDHWPSHDHPLPLSELITFAESKKDVFPVAALDIEADIGTQVAHFEPYLKNNAIVGIKLYPGYQRFYPADPRLRPVATLCQRYSKPLIVHTGDLSDPVQANLLKYAHPLGVDELAVKFPDCTIIMAHLGFPQFLTAGNVVAKNDNVYADISGTVVKFESEPNIASLVEQYILDLRRVLAYFPLVKSKLLFGTDFFNEDSIFSLITPYLEVVEHAFAPEDQPLVLGELAEKLFFSA